MIYNSNKIQYNNNKHLATDDRSDAITVCGIIMWFKDLTERHRMFILDVNQYGQIWFIFCIIYYQPDTY